MELTQAQISVAALRHNLSFFREILGPQRSLIAMVKANAYGHGAQLVSDICLQAGVDMLAVARIEEGRALKQAFPAANILVTGGTLPCQLADSVQYDLISSVYLPAQVYALQQSAAAAHKTARVHIKVDTGMHRTGVVTPAQIEALCAALRACPLVQAEALFTHFALADSPAHIATVRQFQAFLRAQISFCEQGFSLPAHSDNTAAMLLREHPLLEGGRLGIGLYGLAPSEDTAHPSLQRVLRWVTRVVDLHELSPGESVSYGYTFTAQRPTRIATLPVGYADGYCRAFGNRAAVLLHGQRAMVVGRVCMDHIMVDVTALPTVEIGQEAVLLGQQGQEEITAEELAQLANTISYEILSGIGPRVPRVPV